MMQLLRSGFAVAACVWALSLPLAAQARALKGSSTAARVASLVYAAGAVVCHQRPERTMVLASMPLPVCARCTGIYVGAALAVLLCTISTPTRNASAGRNQRRVRLLVLASVVPSGATLAYEWMSGDVPSNAVRAAAGLPIGAVVTWVVLRATQTGSQSG